MSTNPDFWDDDDDDKLAEKDRRIEQLEAELKNAKAGVGIPERPATLADGDRLVHEYMSASTEGEREAIRTKMKDHRSALDRRHSGFVHPAAD